MPDDRPVATALSTVVIIMAMAEEARPLIEALSFQPLPGIFAPLPMQAYEAGLKRLQVRLVLNGEDPSYGVQNIGTQAATLAAQAAIQAFRPDLLMNAGTAGGFASHGAEIGTVYLSAAFKYHDRRIPLPGYDAYGIGDSPPWRRRRWPVRSRCPSARLHRQFAGADRARLPDRRA